MGVVGGVGVVGVVGAGNPDPCRYWLRRQERLVSRLFRTAVEMPLQRDFYLFYSASSKEEKLIEKKVTSSLCLLPCCFDRQ